MNENQQDVLLLKDDPQGLILKYQPIIKIIVRRYVQSGFIHIQDSDDFIQFINEKLLNKIKRIQENYNGKALLKTYMSVIMRNLCREKINKEEQVSTEELAEDHDIGSSEDTISGIVIEQELDRLTKILSFFYKQKTKLEFCLKLLYRIPVTKKDIEDFCPGKDEKEYHKLLDTINPNVKRKDKEIYAMVTPFLNKCEQKSNSPDAIRKWTKNKIEEMIKLMNGNPVRANYNNETLQILFEKYYFRKKL